MNAKQRAGGSIIALVSLLATFTFLFIGFTQHIWSPTWLVFLIIPVVSIFVDIVTKKKDVVGLVSGVVSMLCFVGYLLMGFLLNLWHPGWLIFFAVPISGVITKMFAGETKTDENETQTK